MIKLALIDRDGVINRFAPEGDYIKSWEEFQFLPYVAEAIAKLNKAKIKVAIVTNQRAVAKNIMNEETLRHIHEEMKKSLAEHGAKVDAVYYCPHAEGECSCRKPLPGMLHQAIKDFGVKPEECVMVGDHDYDLQAGSAAGVGKNIFIAHEHRSLGELYRMKETYGAEIVSSLYEAAEYITAELQAMTELQERKGHKERSREGE